MITAAPTLILLLLCLLGSGLWVGIALMATGVISLELFRDMPTAKLMAFDLWTSLNRSELMALPLFILMGEILFQTRLSQNLFKGLAPILKHLPGGLLHTNIVGCGLFAAVSGSSAATTQTIGRMTLPELEKRGYDTRLALGSLCGSGTLGFLIPPSIILILYGVLAEVSILDLFIAGIIPGMLLSLCFMIYVGVRSYNAAPLPTATDDPFHLLDSIKALLPVSALIILVIGSMYSGITSPSEAAVLGVLGAFIIGLFDRSLTYKTLISLLEQSVKTISMIGLIISGALFLSKVLAYLQIPVEMASFIHSLGLSPFMLIVVLIFFYIILGMVVDGLSAIVMTLPIVMPMILEAGYSPLWFGIFLVIVVEMSQITPPVGFNLFIAHKLTGKNIGYIAAASMPFFIIMVLFSLIITLFPQIILWLPAQL